MCGVSPAPCNLVTDLDLLCCNCHQMDLTAEYAMIAADVLYRGKGVTLLVSHTWILEGNIRSTIGCDS